MGSLSRQLVDGKEDLLEERGDKEAELQWVLKFRLRLHQLVDLKWKEAVEWDLVELELSQQSVLN